MKLLFSKLLLALVAVFTINSAVFADEDMEGKTAYTAINIWYERPTKILATNYHKGAIIPVGTKVTIDSVDTKAISFTDDTGANYRIVINLRHTNMPGEQQVKRIFSTKNPKAKGGKYHKFSKKERSNIDNGTVAIGMSKEAVIMSYGYPPTSRTPNTKSNNWTYWKNRWVTQILRFKNNKVSNIQG